MVSGSAKSNMLREPDNDLPWRPVESYRDELYNHALRAGTTGEIKELLEKTNELKTELFLKNQEFELLEMLAMESDNENIVQLRNELFALVKLIHDDDLKQLMSDFRNRDYDDYYVREDSVSSDIRTKESLVSRVRDWFSSRRNEQARKKTRTALNRNTPKKQKRIMGATMAQQSAGTPIVRSR